MTTEDSDAPVVAYIQENKLIRYHNAKSLVFVSTRDLVRWRRRWRLGGGSVLVSFI